MDVRKKFLTCSVIAMATLATLVPVQAQGPKILTATVLSAFEAANVDLGSKHAMGYYANRNGRCRLTLMMSEDGLEKASTDGSAARLSLVVNPGATARVESVEGKSAEFFCGPGARRMIVKTFVDRSIQPQS